MPSQQEVRWSQLKVGVIVLISVVILTTLLFLMTSSSGMSLFSHKLTITSYFENAAGIKPGAAVNLEGVTIGNVKAVTISGAPERKLTPVQLTMKIDPKYQSGLHTDSKASLTTVGVLGDTVVDINSQQATGPMLRDGDELKTSETPNLVDVMKASQGTIESLNVILAKLNNIVDNLQSGQGSMGKLLNDPELYNRLDGAAGQVEKLSKKLNASDNSIGKFFNDNAEMYNRLNETIARVDGMTKDLQAGKGSVGKFLTDDSAYNNLNDSLASLKSLLADMQAGKGSMGMLLKDPTFAKKLNETLTQTDEILTQVNQGQGSIGKLLKDDTTTTNLNKLLTESTNLVTTIRQDPKKYLTIRLHIF